MVSVYEYSFSYPATGRYPMTVLLCINTYLYCNVIILISVESAQAVLSPGGAPAAQSRSEPGDVNIASSGGIKCHRAAIRLKQAASRSPWLSWRKPRHLHGTKSMVR